MLSEVISSELAGKDPLLAKKVEGEAPHLGLSAPIGVKKQLVGGGGAALRPLWGA